mmetsp:Transcript_20562/g.38588  ORF Transcript_20562/g.38588 Transcript_20562/m.38588 type:complete len:237 (-) Transcript_20562:349-1059(-)
MTGDVGTPLSLPFSLSFFSSSAAAALASSSSSALPMVLASTPTGPSLSFCKSTPLVFSNASSPLRTASPRVTFLSSAMADFWAWTPSTSLSFSPWAALMPSSCLLTLSSMVLRSSLDRSTSSACLVRMETICSRSLAASRTASSCRATSSTIRRCASAAAVMVSSCLAAAPTMRSCSAAMASRAPATELSLAVRCSTVALSWARSLSNTSTLLACAAAWTLAECADSASLEARSDT